MSSPETFPISIQPVISYPRQAEVRKIYLMEIDIKQTDDFEKWTYDEEEYPIYCRVDTYSYSRKDITPLFKIQPIGEPAVVLHRFGGTYGAAKFLLTAAPKEMRGEIRITLVSSWGVTLKRLPLKNVSVFQEGNINNNKKEIKREKHLAHCFTEDLGNGIVIDMISIPGGSFMMGSRAEEGSDFERPQHQVTIQPFFMGKFQVTQAQWQTVMGNNPTRFQDSPLNPVEQVSWEDAKKFCASLSEKTKREYRLPTEAEWEYACRAGTETPFHFGQNISTELANYKGEYIYAEGGKRIYRKQTTPVGYFKVANNFGLYDMHGNVWEWCEDNWHQNYRNAPKDGSAWLLGSSSKKVIRGGSWNFNFNACRSANRSFDNRENRLNDIGFRVACVAFSTT